MADVSGGVDTEELRALQRHATSIRRRVLTMAAGKGRGYAGQGLEIADILAALYCGELRLDLAHPTAPESDRFVLSAGHYAIGLYSALVEAGVLAETDIADYAADGAWLQPTTLERPERGVEITGGSLAQGLPVACGLALGGALRGLDRRVFVLLSDGELQEGATWEAAMLAAHRGLDRLVAIVSVNRTQADGSMEHVLDPGPIAEKWRAFGWLTDEIDGNDVCAVAASLRSTRIGRGAPSAIVCRTRLGAGVPFIAERERRHFVRIEEGEWALALEQLIAEPAP